MKPLRIYKASAGSGKTFTLAVEYIALLAINPLEYQNILAVTFTNKATAEMKQRILSTLYAIANNLPSGESYVESILANLKERQHTPPYTEEPYRTLLAGMNREILQARAKEALENIIHDYSRFHIETIDSFFQGIVREIANELELSVKMKVELDDSEVLSDAVDHIITNLKEGSSEFRTIIEFIEEKIRENRSWQVEDTVKEFGRNIFNNQMLTFQPNMNMATPANYRLGAGDEVIIDVWGASQETFTETISPDGVVTITGVGPCKIGGMSVSEATAYLRSRLGRFYSDSSIQLSVGGTRSIQVQVMGEVNVPGTYTLSSLSSAFNALYAAGGINDIGTLRGIKVYRQGRMISTIDVYDYLLNGNSRGDVRLNDNDIIVVGPYDALVEIHGKVKRPMFYEMKKNESLSTILGYSGGFTGDAYKKSIRVTRKNGAEYSMHTVGEFDWNGFTLADGDSIYVDSVIARYSNMVEVRGAVFHSGMYQMDGGISTVRELIKAAEGLREDAFTARAVMHRQKDDLSLEVLAINVEGIMAGTAADIRVKYIIQASMYMQTIRRLRTLFFRQVA